MQGSLSTSAAAAARRAAPTTTRSHGNHPHHLSPLHLSGSRARPVFSSDAVADAGRCARRRGAAAGRVAARAAAASAAAIAVAAAARPLLAAASRPRVRRGPLSPPPRGAAATEPTTTTTKTPERLGVVIVDHGSRRAASNDALIAFCDVYKALQQQQLPVWGRQHEGAPADNDAGSSSSNSNSSSSSSSSGSDSDGGDGATTSIVVAVEPAHMELAEPTIEQAVARCAERGASRVVVAPFFLSRGRHIQDDIPELVEAARRAHPGVEVAVAEPLGADMEGLARILLANVEKTASAAAAATAAAAAAAAAA